MPAPYSQRATQRPMPHHRRPSLASRQYDYSEWISSVATIQIIRRVQRKAVNFSGLEARTFTAVFAPMSFIFPQMLSQIPAGILPGIFCERPTKAQLLMCSGLPKGRNLQFCPVNSRKIPGDRFASDCVRHHPVYSFVVALRPVGKARRWRGFLTLVWWVAVSVRGSVDFSVPVSGRKISVPGGVPFSSE